MAGQKFTEEELELLTEEERAGLLEEDETDGDDGDSGDDTAVADDADTIADKTSEDGAGEDHINDDKDKAADKKESEAAAGKEDDTIESAAAAAETEEAAATPKTQSSTRIPNWNVPADTDEKIKGLDAQIDDLATKFDDGELTAKEYREQSRALDEQKQDLRDLKFKASMAHDIAVENWTKVAVPEFFAAHTQYEKGSFLYKALDAEVRVIQSEAADPFDPDILAKAHQRLQEQLLKAVGSGAAVKTDPKPDAKKTTAKREIPPSLAHVPAADISETEDNSDFAYLDRLAESDPLKYEETLARMTEAERDRYLEM